MRLNRQIDPAVPAINLRTMQFSQRCFTHEPHRAIIRKNAGQELLRHTVPQSALDFLGSGNATLYGYAHTFKFSTGNDSYWLTLPDQVFPFDCKLTRVTLTASGDLSGVYATADYSGENSPLIRLLANEYGDFKIGVIAPRCHRDRVTDSSRVWLYLHVYEVSLREDRGGVAYDVKHHDSYTVWSNSRAENHCRSQAGLYKEVNAAYGNSRSSSVVAFMRNTHVPGEEAEYTRAGAAVSSAAMREVLRQCDVVTALDTAFSAEWYVVDGYANSLASRSSFLPSALIGCLDRLGKPVVPFPSPYLARAFDAPVFPDDKDDVDAYMADLVDTLPIVHPDRERSSPYLSEFATLEDVLPLLSLRATYPEAMAEADTSIVAALIDYATRRWISCALVDICTGAEVTHVTNGSPARSSLPVNPEVFAKVFL